MKRLLYIILVALVAILCYGCRTTRYVPVQTVTQIRDSVVLRDSVLSKEIINKRDSVVLRDSFVIVLDDDGNVIRTELYRQKEIYNDLQKDYKELQSRYDLLLSQKTDSIRIPYPVEREFTWWQNVKMQAGGFALLIIIAGFVFILIKKILPL